MPETLDERLREAHARIPEPSEEARAAARERLDAAVAAERGVEGRLDRDSRGPVVPRRRWWGSRGLVRVGGAAAALALAVAVVVALWPGRADTPSGGPRLPGLPGAPASAQAAERACLQAPSGPAHTCLQAIARIAGAQEAFAAGAVFYQRNRWVQTSTRLGPPGSPSLARWRSIPGAKRIFMVVRETSEELWLTADGGGETRYGDDGPWRPASAWDRRAWHDAGSPDLDALLGSAQPRWEPKRQRFGAGKLEEVLLTSGGLDSVLPPRDRLSVLPHTVAGIEAWLQRATVRQTAGNCAHSSAEVCASLRRSMYPYDITVFLRWPLTPPDQRRALLEALARVPGAHLLHGQRDLAGRPVATIVLPGVGADGENVVAFDPRTARLVGKGARQGDSVRWTSAYAVRTAAVGRVGQRP